ncbi:hypothetical protein HZA99_02845 [Candidatus Woesearchaeota archaeon]|nr:hypothetical protein [Candidatus Woesearchaeota archaeon]
MKKQFCTIIFSMILSILMLSSVFAATWPADTTGTELAGGLGTYEPSGAVWHSRLGQLFVVSDEGLISKMNADGSSVTTWNIGGDLEGIAVADPNSNYVYVINEYPFALYQFDISTGTKTKSWDLSTVVPAPANTRLGLEGMTYIPSEDYSTSSGRGVFAVGSQETGTIYFLDIDTSTNGGSVTLLRSMKPLAASLSDLFYDRETNVLYGLYDSTLIEMSLQGTITATYTVPGSDQEGVTLTTSCSSTTTTTAATIYIASDTPASVMKYGNYPVSCPIVTTTTPPATIDPNLISSETINGATITVNYADGHVQELTPYSTSTVQAAVNYDSTRLITSNGKYVSVYKNGALMTKVKVTTYTPSIYTLSVTHESSSDTVVVSYKRSNKLITATYTLQNDALTRVSTTSVQV